MIHVCQPKAEEFGDETPPPGTECGRNTPDGACTKPAAGYVLFPAGAVPLCRKHLKEEREL